MSVTLLAIKNIA